MRHPSELAMRSNAAAIRPIMAAHSGRWKSKRFLAYRSVKAVLIFQLQSLQSSNVGYRNNWIHSMCLPNTFIAQHSFFERINRTIATNKCSRSRWLKRRSSGNFEHDQSACNFTWLHNNFLNSRFFTVNVCTFCLFKLTKKKKVESQSHV